MKYQYRKLFCGSHLSRIVVYSPLSCVVLFCISHRSRDKRECFERFKTVQSNVARKGRIDNNTWRMRPESFSIFVSQYSLHSQQWKPGINSLKHWPKGKRGTNHLFQGVNKGFFELYCTVNNVEGTKILLNAYDKTVPVRNKSGPTNVENDKYKVSVPWVLQCNDGYIIKTKISIYIPIQEWEYSLYWCKAFVFIVIQVIWDLFSSPYKWKKTFSSNTFSKCL